MSSQVFDEQRKYRNFFSSVGALVLAHVRIASYQRGYFGRVLGVTFCFYKV